MKIFLSWSGTRSKCIATQLHWWLPHVLQSVDPFISSQNISKGARGSIVLADELENANVGIICLTPENQLKPWILYEGGALSKLQADYLCTFLHDLTPSDVNPPLGDFQHTRNTDDDICQLVRDINRVLPAGQRLIESILSETLKTWLPKLRARLDEVPEPPENEPVPEERDDSSKIDELLGIVRGLQTSRTSVNLRAPGTGKIRNRGTDSMLPDYLSSLLLHMYSIGYDLNVIAEDVRLPLELESFVNNLDKKYVQRLRSNRILARSKNNLREWHWGPGAEESFSF